MRPLAGKRITRINLEFIKGDAGEVLRPFVFEEFIIPLLEGEIAIGEAWYDISTGVIKVGSFWKYISEVYVIDNETWKQAI